MVFAVPLGLIAGFFRGAVDSVIMRAMDAMFSFPPLILALTVAALLGASINDTAIAIAIVFIPSFVRLLRGEVIAVREENYIEAARSLGATSNRLIRRHVVPNVASPIIIQVSLSLGLRPAGRGRPELPGYRASSHPRPSWGSMLNEGYRSSSPRRGPSSSPVWPSCSPSSPSTSWPTGSRDSLGRERPKSSSLVSTATILMTRLRRSPLGPNARSRRRADRRRSRRRLPCRPCSRLADRRPHCFRSTAPHRVPDQRPMVPGDGGCELQRRPGQDAWVWSERAARARPSRPWPSWASCRPGVAGPAGPPGSRGVTSCASPRLTSARSAATRSP